MSTLLETERIIARFFLKVVQVQFRGKKKRVELTSFSQWMSFSHIYNNKVNVVQYPQKFVKRSLTVKYYCKNVFFLFIFLLSSTILLIIVIKFDVFAVSLKTLTY